MPDDETVNQMIARSEEEFELFMVSFCVFECEVEIQLRKNRVPTSFPVFSSSCFRSVWTWTDAARRLVTHDENHG